MSAEATRRIRRLPGGHVAAIRPIVTDPSLAVIAFYGDAERWLPCARIVEVSSPWAARPTPETDGGCTITLPEDDDTGYRRRVVWRVPLGDGTHVVVRGHLTLQERANDALLLVFTGRYGRASGEIDPDDLQRTLLLDTQDLLQACADGLNAAGAKLMATMAQHPATGS